MGEPEVVGRGSGSGGGGGSGSGDTGGGGVAGRTRKRILDPLEAQEDDSTARRLGVFTDWQETIKGIGVPNKKGYMSMEGGHQRPWESEDIDQGLAADLDDSLSGLGVDISTVGNQQCHHPDYCCGPYHHHHHHSSPAVHHVEKVTICSLTSADWPQFL